MEFSRHQVRARIALRNKMRLRGSAILMVICVPIFLYLILPSLIVVPMALTSGQLLQFPPVGLSLHSFREVFTDPAWVAAFETSLRVAALAIVLSVVLGSLAALGLHGSDFAGKGSLLGVLLTPVAAPLIVLALADYEFFDRIGILGSWEAIGLAHAVLGTPYVILTTQASLAGLDAALVRSARSLGAGAFDLLRFVYWPIIRPGMLAGALFVFAISFDEVVISYFLQSADATTVATKMFIDIRYSLSPTIAAVSAVLLGVTTLVLAGQSSVTVMRRAGSARRLASLDAAIEFTVGTGSTRR
jgi:putative spermidine/putrescine transport system permease protein